MKSPGGFGDNSAIEKVTQSRIGASDQIGADSFDEDDDDLENPAELPELHPELLKKYGTKH